MGFHHHYSDLAFSARRGGIGGKRTNIINLSSNLANANWSKTNVTATATTDSDGGSNAYTLQATASALTSVISGAVVAPVPTVTGPHICSVIGKIGTGATDANKLLLLNTVTSTIICNLSINWTTGVISGATVPSGTTSTNLGSGWWLIRVPFANLTAGQRINVYLAFAGAAETAGENATWYGPMLETGTTAPAARVLT